jgi:N-acetyl sugar amidotransferase
MIRYCTSCLYPETKPDLSFDDRGVCSACISYEKRTVVDWTARSREFLTIIDRYRSKDGSNYDCVVPVSGGKDSTYQVLRCLQHNLNPLCVTATTCSLTDIGRRNIENLKRLGVDYLEVSVNPDIRHRINKLGLTQVGDISWPEHLTIFTVPVRIAVQFGIRLLIWGENSQNEYGGPAASQEKSVLDRRWLEEFGGLLGLRVSDLIGQSGIERRHLLQYTYPTDEELQRVGVTGIFLGHYFPWDGLTNAMLAQAYGFESYGKVVEGHFVDYENLDNSQAGLHEYFMFLKYGFGRATAQANMHIRRGRLLRSDAIDAVKRLEGKFPWTYLGRPLEEILKEIDIGVEEFQKVCDRYTNKKLFVCDGKGALVHDKNGNLTKINYDNS